MDTKPIGNHLFWASFDQKPSDFFKFLADFEGHFFDDLVTFLRLSQSDTAPWTVQSGLKAWLKLLNTNNSR